MNEKLKKGQTLSTKLGVTVTIKEWLAEGGQGDVYLVEYAGEEKVLKWYKKAAIGDNSQMFYDNLVDNIHRKRPDSHFIWPEDITPYNNGQYGYIMEVLPTVYYEVGDFMNKVVMFKNYRIMIDAALNMIKAFRILHNAGLFYQDINEGNFAIDPNNGDVKIMDNDNVAPSGKSTGVLGKPRYMAPEIVIGISNHQRAIETKADYVPPFVMPSVQSDLYSMAVILYILFTLNHPMEGKHYLVPGLTVKTQERLYGKDVAFMMENNGKGNDPDPIVHKNSLIIWPMLPKYIQELFLKALGEEGIKNPSKRPQEVHWVDALVRFRSDITTCPNCKMEVFVKDGRSCCCHRCSEALKIPYRLEFLDYAIPGKKGARIYASQFKTVNYEEMLDIAGTIVAKPNEPSSLWVLNKSDESWRVTTPSGKHKRINPGEVLPLKDNLSFEAGKTAVRVKKN